MDTKKIFKTIGKMVITLSSMIAINEVICYHANPYKSATSIRLSCNIAGYTTGFVLGRFVSDEVIDYLSELIESRGE